MWPSNMIVGMCWCWGVGPSSAQPGEQLLQSPRRHRMGQISDARIDPTLYEAGFCFLWMFIYAYFSRWKIKLKVFEETRESLSQIILIVQILIMSLVLDNSSHFDPFSNWDGVNGPWSPCKHWLTSMISTSTVNWQPAIMTPIYVHTQHWRLQTFKSNRIWCVCWGIQNVVCRYWVTL